ncbi:hypothetical protein NQ166_06785 [Microbacterium sp. zg.Y1090]|uniref:hypothetical protein n=1 Tax=Microbacterium TaxID=33882 RepID=UPI00214C41FB|nr:MULTISPECIES: hypothetical protein [unclassified Microbacterium]MCR2812017.1 hypothetical protein [Microbacterium sp. zg.Y1084]MCR2818544.1 hypothetical protein [Microbacterium sp. zg.Y1090]MDL5486357.1 hypothetical protein [Microbacterium sp. zg-Y1211]WIM29549.1 hypothetical protein QNO26_06595 [Microbacterium sp. zg-Y1090]
MYQLNSTASGVLATTGAALAHTWVAGWTLFVAGLAALSVGRVVRMRRKARTEP